MKTTPLPELVNGLLTAFTNKDLESTLAYFTIDAIVYDPHYPTPEMKGIAAIRQGFKWGLDGMEKPGFTIRNTWFTDSSGAAQIDTHHILKNGTELQFSQVFVFETRAGKISRLQAYVPYRPPGLGGLLAKITRLVWRIKGTA